MRVFLLAFCVLAFVADVQSQAPADKITPQEYIEANEFARKFWKRLLATADVEPLIDEYGEKNFYQCLDLNDFQSVRDDQIRPARQSQLKRLYLAETIFMIRLVLWGGSRPKILSMDDDDDPFVSFPREVQKAMSKKTWELVDKNEGNFNLDKQESDQAANAYFDKVLVSLERANPVWLKHISRSKTNRASLTKHLAKYEVENEYAFRPELSDPKYSCERQKYIPRPIIVDVPFLQMRVGKVDGKLKLLQLPFHIDS